MTRLRRLWWSAAILILTLGSGGCGGGGASASPSDLTEGRKTLQSILDAWKSGEKPDALAQRTPPVRVTDGDWISGLKLQSYQLEDEGTLVGSDLNYKVTLELKTAKGKGVKRDAVYAVITQPQLMISRQDSL